jgi:hypothetical protein
MSGKDSKTQEQVLSQIQMKEIFYPTITTFVTESVPLSVDNEYLYFLTKSGQLYGFDNKRQLLFEPNDTKKFSLFESSFDLYFTEENKESLHKMAGVNFSDLNNLVLRKNYHEKYVGKKFYYSKAKNSVYVWDITTSKWEIGNTTKLRHLFSNNDIIQKDGESIGENVFVSSKGMSFADLKINESDLEEIDLRFKDGCVHYIHKVQNKIYSCNNFQNYWFIPSEAIQTQIMKHYNEKNVKTD